MQIIGLNVLVRHPGNFQRDARGRERRGSIALLAGLPFCGAMIFAPTPAKAEVTEVRLARQYGISHLAMAIMDELQLVQKQTEKGGSRTSRLLGIDSATDRG